MGYIALCILTPHGKHDGNIQYKLLFSIAVTENTESALCCETG